MAGFCRLWAVAALAHIIGNRPRELFAEQITPLRLVLLLLGGAALWLVLAPADRRAQIAVATLVPLSWWFEAPFTGNHWLLAAFVSIGLLAASVGRLPWSTFVPFGRVTLLAFYSFAAFAKLNEGFLASRASCGIFYPNQMLGAVHLPLLATGSVVGRALPIVTAAIELAVPVLLLIPRSRRCGVLLAVAFHSTITLDFDQHFYDFTAVLIPLFFCFLDDGALAKVAAAKASERTRAIGVGLGGAVVYLAVVPQNSGTEWLVRYLAFVVWIPVAAACLRIAWQAAAVARIGRPPRWGLAIAAVVVLNGLTPYLGIKTATSWNMYANLETVDGSSNHYVVPGVAELRDMELATVVASDDEGLARYIDSGYSVPLANLAAYLDRHPESTVTVRDESGDEVILDATNTDAPNVLVRKVLPVRSVDTEDPPRCQAEFLPAL